MLPDLLTPLAGEYQFFNLFRYITFRTGGATITALLISLIFGPAMIRWLKSHQAEGQPIRADGPESHLLTKIGSAIYHIVSIFPLDQNRGAQPFVFIIIT